MKTVRLKNNVVMEIIPDYALPVEKWYGEAFAAECMKAPDDVEQGLVYDPVSMMFSPAGEDMPEPSLESDLLEMTVDHEYRLTLLELGVI